MSETKKTKKPETEASETQSPVANDAASEAEKIIAEAKAEAARIVAEAEAKAETAPQTEPDPQANPGEELVDYTAPLLPNMKRRDVFVAVNGETLRIQRGVSVRIKRKFYEALQNAAKQEFAAFESRQQIQKQSEKPLAAM